MRSPDRLARLHRVRDVQLRLAEAAEAQARDKATSEAELHRRVAQLAHQVAPTAIGAAALGLGAAAHYRERLQRSADATLQRVRQADALLDRATEDTRSARQDRSAIEKLIERARDEAAVRERRALQDLPPGPARPTRS